MTRIAELRPLGVPLAVQAHEIRRELAVRERVYPAWVEAGRISANVAAQRIATLKAVLETIEGLAAKERLL